MKIRLLRTSLGSCLGNQDATVIQLPLPEQQCHCILFNVGVFLSVLFLYNSSLEIKYQGESIFVSQGGLIVFLSGGGKQALYDGA